MIKLNKNKISSILKKKIDLNKSFTELQKWSQS